jgi:hypothetical protein
MGGFASDPLVPDGSESFGVLSTRIAGISCMIVIGLKMIHMKPSCTIYYATYPVLQDGSP